MILDEPNYDLEEISNQIMLKFNNIQKTEFDTTTSEVAKKNEEIRKNNREFYKKQKLQEESLRIQGIIT